MLRSMFGMGGSEILVILVIALLFLGPDKLPEVTKAISKGVRDLKKHSRVLQQTIENDENIGGAIRDLSLDGVFILDPEPLPVGATIKFSLRLGTEDVPLQGIVRRSVDEEGMGIQFTDISREAKRRLRMHFAGRD